MRHSSCASSNSPDACKACTTRRRPTPDAHTQPHRTNEQERDNGSATRARITAERHNKNTTKRNTVSTLRRSDERPNDEAGNRAHTSASQHSQPPTKSIFILVMGVINTQPEASPAVISFTTTCMLRIPGGDRMGAYL